MTQETKKVVMVCGVDCHPGDGHCNGYCEGKMESPPESTEEQKLEAARHAAHRALDAAEKAWYAYAGMIDVGPDRIRAFDVYQNVRLARRVF